MKNIYLLRTGLGLLTCFLFTLQLTAQCNITVDISSDPPPQLYNLCPGETITLTANPSGGTGPYTYSWQGITSNGATTQSIDIAPPLNSNFLVTVTDANGCVGFDFVHVKATLWYVDVTADADPICQGQEMELYVLTAFPTGTEFLWSTGETTPNIFVGTSGNYSLTVTSPSGCTASDSFFANIIPTPPPNPVIVGPSMLCPGQTATLSVLNGPYDYYFWVTADHTETTEAWTSADYWVFVTNVAGCGAYDTLTILPGNLPPPILNGPPFLCSGQNGVVQVNNASDYGSFQWNTGQTTSSITVTQPGTYSVTVTQIGGGCTAIGSFTVNNNSVPITVTATATPNTSCTASNGALNISVSPSGTYTYNWSNGSTTEDLANLTAGPYTVTVTAGGNCSATASFTVTNNFNNPSASAVSTPASCGQNNGSINLSVSNGVSPFTFNWSNGANTEDVINLGPGPYTVTVTGANGCTTVASTTVVNNNVPLSITGNTTANTSCLIANGNLNISVSPAGSYTFNWSNGPTMEDLVNLNGGTYTVTVTAGGTCSATASFVVPNSPNNPVTSTTPSPASCGQNNGSIDLDVSGGVSPFTFNWSNGANTEDVINLGPGPYTVTVTGANGCTAVASATVVNNNTTLAITGNTTPNTACLVANGSLNISVLPAGPYSFNWSNGATFEDVANLDGGTYTVTVTAGGTCSATASFVVPNNPNNPATSAAPSPATCGQNNGSIDLDVSGGVSPFTFNWSNGANTEDLINLGPGPYTVTVTGVNGCTAVASATVLNNNTTLSITGNAVPNTSCLVANGSLNISVLPAGSYTFNWSNGTTVEDPANLNGGTYTVTVTAGGTCSATASFVVPNSPNNPVTSAAPSPATCGQNDGGIDLDVSGGVSPFTFNWSNGTNTEDVINLGPGPYTVTVTGANGCTAVASATVVNNNTTLAITGNTTANTACLIANGNLNISVSPAGSYTFNWSNGPTMEDLVNLNGGTYTVTVTAGGTCSATASFVVPNSPNNPVTSATPSPASCGQNNGSIDLDVSGGVSPFTFNWSNGANTEDVVNLGPGPYTVTVTGANGCTAVASATVVNNNVPLAITGNITANTACLVANGSLNISVLPAGPYTFNWSNSATTEDLPNLNGGTYTVTVTAGGTCSATASFVVPNSPNSPVTSAAPSSATCGQNNGGIDLNVSGGVSPFTFNWSNGANTEDVVNLAPGPYTVTVTGANSCTAIAGATVVNNNTTLAITGNTVANTSCLVANGSIAITTSPSGNYVYTWSNGPASQNITNLPAGTYTVTVDAGGSCTASASFTVTNNTATPDLSPIVTPAQCGAPDGAIDLDVSGAPDPFAFAWSNGATTQNLSNVAAGNYSVTVTALADGCSATIQINIPNNSNSFTLNGSASPETSCSTPNGTVNLTILPAGNYDIAWSNGALTEDLTGLSAGLYTVTVTAQGSCTGEASFIVGSQQTAPVLAQNVSPASCGLPNGSIDLTVSGGVAPYTFAWSNGATTQTLQDLAPAGYTVTLSDANGCTTTGVATVTALPVPQVAVSGPASACTGVNVLLTASLGFTAYSWSGGQLTPGIAVSQSGTYTVTATDAAGCTAVASHTYNPFPLPVATMTGPASICTGSAATLGVAGNFAQINWSTGSTDSSIQVSQAGAYSVTVTDVNGCTATAGQALVLGNSITPDIAVSVPVCSGLSTLDAGTGYTNYVWSTGATSRTISVNTSGNYTVTVSDAGGCTGTNIAVVTIPAPPQVAVSGPATACAGDSVSLTASAGFSSYIWSDGQSTASINISLSGTYKVTATDANGCTAVASQGFTSSPPPTVSISGPASICTGGSAAFAVNGAFNQINWSTGATTPGIHVSQPGTYSVTVTDANGCTAVADQGLSVGNSITPDIAVSVPVCSGLSTLDAGTGYTNYVWSTGATSRTISVNTSGNYTVTVSDGSGCTGTNVAVVTIPAPPQVAVSGPATACAGENVSLTASAGFSSYIWSDGQSTASINVSLSGTYMVTATDANGCTVVASQDFTSSPTPTVSISGPASICTGGSAAFAVNGAFNQINWSNGATTPGINVSQPGTYSVTVTDANGCTAIADQGLSVGSSLLPEIFVLPTCSGTATLDAGAGYATYLWSTGETTQTISFNTNGSYSLTVSDAGGCTGTSLAAVTIPAPPQVAVSGPATACAGTNISLSASAGFTTYVWSGGQNSLAINITQSGNYTVTATDAGGCTATANQLVIFHAPDLTILEKQSCVVQDTGTMQALLSNRFGCDSLIITHTSFAPSFDVVASATSDFQGMAVSCHGSSDGAATVVPQGGSAPYLFHWNNNASAASVQHLSAGTYSVTVTDANGCSAATSVLLKEPSPLIAGLAEEVVECFTPGRIIVQTVGGGTGPYTIQAMGRQVTTDGLEEVDFQNVAPGSYTIAISDANGCTSMEQVVLSAPVGTLQTFSDHFQVQAGDTVQLHAPTGFPGASPSWSPAADLSCAHCPDPWLVASEAAEYNIVLQGYGSCRVVGHYTITLRADDVHDPFYIPNVIKPGSAENGVFTIYSGKDLVNIKLLRIFTRWGEHVTDIHDFPPNGPTGWEGDFRGKPVNPGVFVYYAELEFVDGTVRLVKGDVTVVR